MAIVQGTRRGGFGLQTKIQAIEALFLQTHHRGPIDWVEGTYLGRGKLGLRVGDLGQKPKTKLPGLGFQEHIMGGGGALIRIIGT